jgi:hypothetical protein
MRAATKVTDWLQNNRKLAAVAGVLLLAILLISIGLTFRKKNSVVDMVPKPVVEPVTVNIAIDPEDSHDKKPQHPGKIITFSLKPSPAEMLEQIGALAAADLPVPDEKYAGLQMLWPVYFFKIHKQENGVATTILDGSEDGFGITIVTAIDSGKYPEILEMERGRKIWLAGEISSVDASGTGTIEMRAENVSFQKEMPASVALPVFEPTKKQSESHAAKPAKEH